MTEELGQSELAYSTNDEVVLTSIETRDGLVEAAHSVSEKSQATNTEESQDATVKGLRRVVYIVLAGFFFVLGALGAILPGLPTTPFLLLTSYFLMKSSPRLNAMLLQSPMFGPILRDWQQRKGIRRDVKIQAITILILFVSGSLYLTQPSFVIAGVITSAALIGVIVIFRLPEIPGKGR